MAVPIYVPTNSVGNSLFYTSLLTFFIFVFFVCLFVWWQPFWQVWVNISLWFWFASPWWLAVLGIFSYACWPSALPLWKNVCSVLQPIVIGLCGFFWMLSYMSCSYILDINPLSVISFADIFSHSVGSFHCVNAFLWCTKAFKFNQVPLFIPAVLFFFFFGMKRITLFLFLH